MKRSEFLSRYPDCCKNRGSHYGENKREQYIKKLAIEKGYEVLRAGWPDFLLYKEKEKIAIFLEVKAKKGPGSELNSRQERMAEVLQRLGLNWKIVYV